MLGLIVDELARQGEWDAIDRVIQAQSWCTDSYATPAGERCFLGHINNGSRDNRFYVRPSRAVLVALLGRMGPSQMQLMAQYGSDPGHWFDMLVARFGMDRVVRAIKGRAGKHTRPNVEQTATPIDSAVKLEHATT